MKIRIILFVLFLLQNCGNLFSQDKVYMPYFEVINMHKDFQEASTRLFKTYIMQEGKYELILPELKDSIYYKETRDETEKQAKALGTKFYILAEINRLGELAVVSVAMYKTEDNNKFWFGTAKALTPDDLDPLLQKVAKSLGKPLTIAESSDIYNVTEYESAPLPKMMSNSLIGITVGGGFAFNNNIKNASPAGFGVSVTQDSRNLIFEARGEMYFSDYDLYQLGIHIVYPFKKTNISPYLSGGLAVTRINETLDNSNFGYESTGSESGMAFNFGAGYLFNRQANANFRAGVNVIIPTFKIEGEIPAAVLVNLSIFF